VQEKEAGQQNAEKKVSHLNENQLENAVANTLQGQLSNEQSTEAQSAEVPHIRPKISAFRLDDPLFNLTQVSVGLQNLMFSESPVISYKIPEMADFVEILRCRKEAGSLSELINVELSGRSESWRSHMYRSRDFFKYAEASQDCELLTDGHSRKDFVDTFAPSGSYRYLVRACVSPGRLSDKEQLSARNCSRRVGISSEFNNFVNKRKRDEQNALKLVATYGSRIDATTNAMQQLAASANEAINTCEDRNIQRTITKKIREGWLTIAAAVAEVSIEITQLNPVQRENLARYYTLRLKGERGPMAFTDIFQLIGATQGYSRPD